MLDLAAQFPRSRWLQELVRQSLDEDIGSGDASTILAVDPSYQAVGDLVARNPGVTAGLPLLEILFGQLDPDVAVDLLVPDGTAVTANQTVARLRGKAASLLTGERTALNFLQHLGGIATLTSRYVQAVAGTACKVLDTRKTLPGYRRLAKYAVLCGGGHNHRLGLYDRIMLKDNHWAAARGTIAELVAASRKRFPDLMIEIEVDDLDQLREVLPLEVEWILLDNFTPDAAAMAVSLRDENATETKLESSGNVDLETVADFARAGVDAVSVGRLTHSAAAWDLGLDLEPSP